MPPGRAVGASKPPGLNLTPGAQLLKRPIGDLPQDVKHSHPKVIILKSGRVVFNIKGNDFRLVTLVRCQGGVLMIRFFGSHEEYDQIDAETV